MPRILSESKSRIIIESKANNKIEAAEQFQHVTCHVVLCSGKKLTACNVCSNEMSKKEFKIHKRIKNQATLQVSFIVRP